MAEEVTAYPAARQRAGSGAIDVWWADSTARPDDAAERWPALLALLTPEERRRYAAISDPLGRAEFATARGLLRLKLAEFLACPPSLARLATTPRGRPYLPDAPGVDVSLAHSTGLVVVAVGSGLAADSRIGVDVEALAPVARARELARRYFSPAERQRLAGLSGAAHTRAWLEIWTRREAYVKACGTGLPGLARAPDRDVGHRWRRLRLPAGFTGSLVTMSAPGFSRPEHLGGPAP